MAPKKVLFISGSIGLGHVGRDLEIAKALRKEDASIDISWLADDPATVILKNAGEKLLPEANFELWQQGIGRCCRKTTKLTWLVGC